MYYIREVDPSMYPGLNEVSITLAKPTQQTLDKCICLLVYIVTHPNTTIRFYTSNMIPNVDSDTAYLVLPRARSRLSEHFYHSSPSPPTRIIALPNGSILTECKTICHLVSSAAEVEIAAPQ